MFHVKHFDVIVIGGGHAGIEASLASARMGHSTLLITMNPPKIGEMSCNPSIGGVGKGQLVKEIDALGGEMGKTADATGIQFKRLNTRKGSAVQSSRCQSDKRKYAQKMRDVVCSEQKLEVLEAEVKEILAEGGEVRGIGVQFSDGRQENIPAGSVVITSGTFMKGVLHCGSEISHGGRHGERSSVGLSDDLAKWGFTILRLKTGTPPRLFRDSIDFSKTAIQPGDDPPRRFSFSSTQILLPQVPCYLTYTDQMTHQIIRQNLHQSPLFSGQIKGIGPRYCPSIEDKVVKFPDKPRHQIFMEPEALDSDWIYPNGISTSLPPEVQEKFVRTIPGCAEIKFAGYGYAVEYDCIDSRQLSHSLEAKQIGGLFLAGQVNGTSGYEEAAAQGLVAGINAALRCEKSPPLHLSRSESYIGVLVDDLVSMGVSEPYRMFTSRAEFRLSLREDNADLRLRDIGYRLGLVSEEDYRRTQERKRRIESATLFLRSTFLKPSDKAQQILESIGTPRMTGQQSLVQLLKRPEVGLNTVMALSEKPLALSLDPETAETLEVELKYEGYIQIQQEEIERVRRLQNTAIPEVFDFNQVVGLSIEMKERLKKHNPRTLAEAARVQGVTPTALSALLFHLRKGNLPHVTTSF